MKAFVIILMLSLFFQSDAMASEVVDIVSRGERTRILIEETPKPWAVAILFAGGKGAMDIRDDGELGWGKGNFVIRTRHYFHENGIATVIIDAPTDHKKSLIRFRYSDEHARDIGEVIKTVRKRFGLPVWLVGTSRGTESVVSASIYLQDNKPDGLVVTSSIFIGHPKQGGRHLLDLEAEKIAQPVLIAHHSKDSCKYTPPSGAAAFAKKLTRAKSVAVKMYDDGSGVKGKECKAFHYHGFAGIERDVVSDIADWIRSQTP